MRPSEEITGAAAVELADRVASFFRVNHSMNRKQFLNLLKRAEFKFPLGNEEDLKLELDLELFGG